MTARQLDVEQTRSEQALWLVLGAVVFYTCGLLLIFHETVSSMVDIWSRSQTFAHGFLVLPISIWLLWRERETYYDLPARPQPYALLLLLLFGTIWLLATMVDIVVLEQLAFVAILTSGIWAIVGNVISARAAFPLLFLLLAVPMGSELIPPLMSLTAATTEIMVRASGVPLYREGMYLYLPTGTWSVIAECSGVRYLIASFTLGLIYAYLTYNSFWRRLLFVLASIAVPIVANSLRAYGVVMMGHLSDMRLGVGVDHLVYGWGFFGLVMVILFWVGGFWQEEVVTTRKPSGLAQDSKGASSVSLLAAAVIAVALAAVWPVIALTSDRATTMATAEAISAPPPVEGWRVTDTPEGFWHPVVEGADRELNQMYEGKKPVALFLRQFLTQKQGLELVTSAEPWRPEPRQTWRVIGQRRMHTGVDALGWVDEVQVRSASRLYLIWSWYHIDGKNLENPYAVKLLEARQQLFDGRRTGARIFVATQISDDLGASRALLTSFTSLHLASVVDSLNHGLQAQ
jgi:exosortase A